MIKNSKQLTVAKDRLAVLRSELSAIENSKEELDPFEYRVSRNNHSELIADLQHEIDYFTDLQQGRIAFIEIKSLEQISDALLAGRIAQQLSQKDLGERLGLPAQQIQRYESFDYRNAGWEKILQIFAALGLTFDGNRIYFNQKSQNIFGNPSGFNDEFKALWKKSLVSEKTFHEIGEYENDNLLSVA